MSDKPQLEYAICGMRANGLVSHITRTHSVAMTEYRARFPEHVVHRNPDSQRQAASDNAIAWWAIPENKETHLPKIPLPSKLEHWTKKGYTVEEAGTAVTEHQKLAAAGWTDETRAGTSKRCSGDENPMSLESIASRFDVTRDEAVKLTPCYGRISELHPFFGEHHTEESLRKIASAHHLTKPTWTSKGELRVRAFCHSLNPDVRTNVRFGRWHVDVVFDKQKLVVEYFGDFWHMNPKKFEAYRVNTVTGTFACDYWERDARKIDDLEELGYCVVVVWESELNESEANVFARIKHAYD